jgi:hypothetical protein
MTVDRGNAAAAQLLRERVHRVVIETHIAVYLARQDENVGRQLIRERRETGDWSCAYPGACCLF